MDNVSFKSGIKSSITTRDLEICNQRLSFLGYLQRNDYSRYIRLISPQNKPPRSMVLGDPHRVDRIIKEANGDWNIYYEVLPGLGGPRKYPKLYKEGKIALFDTIFFDLDKAACKNANNLKEYLKCLEDVYQEAIKLEEYFVLEYGARPIIIYSGFKGFHIYVHVYPLPLSWHNRINHTYYLFFKEVRDELKLRYLDNAIMKGYSKRLARLPWTIYPETKRWVIPVLGDESVDDILYYAENPPIVPGWWIESYEATYSSRLGEHLRKIARRVDPEKKLDRPANHTKTKLGEVDNQNNTIGPLRIAFRNYYKVKYNETPSYIGKDYDTYLCHIHNDTNPSLSVKEDMWKCFGCGKYGFSLEDYLKQVRR